MSVTYKIGEAAARLNLKTHVLRFWETEFPQIVPLRTEKGQRLYTEENVLLLQHIKFLLHEQGLTIEGAKKRLAGDIARGVMYTIPPAPEVQDMMNFGVELDDEDTFGEDSFSEAIGAAMDRADAPSFYVKPPSAASLQAMLSQRQKTVQLPESAVTASSEQEAEEDPKLLLHPSSLSSAMVQNSLLSLPVQEKNERLPAYEAQQEALHMLTSAIDGKHTAFYEEIKKELLSIASLLREPIE